MHRPARLAYSLLLYLLVPFVLLRLLWLGTRNPEYLKRWRERFGRPARLNGSAPVLLVHAVSVGEVLAAKPLLHRLMARHPGHRIIVTTTTPTGAMTVRQSFGERVEHLYFPYDLPSAVESFLDRLAPDAVLVMETEIWPNFFAACARRGIPLALVNARMSARSAAAYGRVPGLVGETLRAPALIAAQSEADAGRLRQLGADPGRVAVCGNLKYDIRFPPSIREQGLAQRRLFSANRPVWIAASTHEGEERAVLRSLRRSRRSCKAGRNACCCWRRGTRSASSACRACAPRRVSRPCDVRPNGRPGPGRRKSSCSIRWGNCRSSTRAPISPSLAAA
jgi:3-deoxy-D-manno-octulosonic-acid transferase